MNEFSTITRFNDFLLKLYGLKKKRNNEILPISTITTIDKIAEKELTIRQLECFIMYYKEKKNIKQISKELSITQPTICRHLQKARLRIYNSIKIFVGPSSVWQ